MKNKSDKNSGLEGITVARTRLSDVDGERGRLVLAGWDVEAIAGALSFEAIAAVFLGLPSEADVKAPLAAARARAYERLARLGDALDRNDGMDALRASLAHGGATLPEPRGGARSALEIEEAIEVIGATAVFAAAWSRRRQGLLPVPPDASRGHASDYLAMLSGGDAGAARAHALETYLVTVADHGMNASTFAARVAASTGTDLVSAVVAGVGTLKGPLHGGAPGPVLDMLDAIGRPEHARGWLERELESGRRIMGMGHRIYRVRDPRAAVLERAIERLEQGGQAEARVALARSVEREAEALLAARHPDRPVRANVEFYTAVLLEAVGLDRRAFSPTFAVGRVLGWCAHVLEQRATGRLIRPASTYVGPINAAPAA